MTVVPNPTEFYNKVESLMPNSNHRYWAIADTDSAEEVKSISLAIEYDGTDNGQFHVSTIFNRLSLFGVNMKQFDGKLWAFTHESTGTVLDDATGEEVPVVIWTYTEYDSTDHWIGYWKEVFENNPELGSIGSPYISIALAIFPDPEEEN